jgi:hypothetical protein
MHKVDNLVKATGGFRFGEPEIIEDGIGRSEDWILKGRTPTGSQVRQLEDSASATWRGL